MKVLLFGKSLKTTDVTFLKSFTSSLVETSIEVYITKAFRRRFKNHKIDVSGLSLCKDEDTTLELDMVLSIGGDGTMLSCALFVGNRGIPILGINLGRMGFLASIDKSYCHKAINQIEDGNFEILSRTMLKLESEKALFGDNPIALNDFTIQKKTSSSMISVHTYVDEVYFNSYWCNGMIVATPTGSTAFSMSCGGPIVLPNTKNFILTSIAPHNLNIRPLILPDDVTLSFKIESRNEKLFCTMDSRNEIIHKDDKLIVKKNDYETKLVQLKEHSYFSTLRNKLMWGKDVRNL